MENMHRTKKRIWEIGLTVDALQPHLANKNADDVQILQFGCGNGDQVAGLNAVGKVVASDIYTHEAIQELQIPFVECSIADTAFSDGQFDVIHSNHVMEHVVDLEGAFRELKRIGKKDCVYAFSVPTSTWMVLTLPTKYVGKLKQAIRLLGGDRRASKIMRKTDHRSAEELRAKFLESKPTKIIKRLVFPGGHGVPGSFSACVRAFRSKQWRQLFESHGFLIEQEVPLLLYGASNFPVVPTMRAKNHFLCSSLLFIMRNSEYSVEKFHVTAKSAVVTVDKTGPVVH